MWVLSTDRAELHYFPSPEDVRGGYAILSHVWDEKEQTLQDIQGLKRWWRGNPRDRASAKIRKCCKLAARHGYKWLWIDTCCIDKTSSTELSEAINSMFRYYSLAKVCYAYLRDVPSDDDPRAGDSAFRKSRWHQRGWTLQELIAPEFVIFVSKDWRPLSSRTELGDLLEEITRIPAPLLKLEAKVSDYSVAQRMSWAAERETTRVEDEAYSLMGIFGIHIPTLYGEGENAFRRLQEEIMRQSVDPSLFLWGRIRSLNLGTMEAIHWACDHEDRGSYLLATSPYAFRYCSSVVFSPSRSVDAPEARIQQPEFTKNPAATANSPSTFHSNRLPTFTLTPHGVRAHLPVIQGANGVLVSMLSCFRRGRPLELLLSPCMHPSDTAHLLYHIGGFEFDRVVAFDDVHSLSVHDKPVAIEWKEVYITPWPPLSQSRKLIPTLLSNTMLSPPFRISEASMDNMSWWRYHLHTVSPTSPTWTGIPHLAAVFRWRTTDRFMAVFLGRCESHSENTVSQERGQLGSHWAVIMFYTVTSEDDMSVPEFPGHACPNDHIHFWPDGAKYIKDPHVTEVVKDSPETAYCWLLSFTPCRINPGITLVVDLKLTKTQQ